MLVSGLSFSSEWTTQALRLGSNGPFWSLSYEVGYYILFGMFVYLSGPWRWLLCALAAVIIGFKVLILAPAWLMGVWLYHRLQTAPNPPRYTLALAVVPIGLYGVFLAIHLPQRLLYVTLNMLTAPGLSALRFSNEFIWNWLIAGCFTAHILGMAYVMRHKNLPISRTIRWLAGASFSIYLVHYPVLQFLQASLPKMPNALAHDGLLLGLTLLICFAFAELFERRLAAFRQLVRLIATPFKQH